MNHRIILALQQFVNLDKRDKTCADMMSWMKHFSYMLKKRNIWMTKYWLGDYTIGCHDVGFESLTET